MKKRRLTRFLFTALIASTALCGCAKKSDGNTKTTAVTKTGTPVTYTALYPREVTTLNYLVTSTILDHRIPANCIDTLVEYDLDGKIKEGLAAEWTYDKAALTWTFKLRDAKWVDHTGAAAADVTAHDFVDAMKYALTPEYESASAQNLFGVIANAQEYYNGLVFNGGADDSGKIWAPIDFSEVGVTAVDDHTLTYTLAAEVPYFLSSLVYVIYMPAYGPQLEELGKSFGTGADKMYYNGAFYLAEFAPQEKQIMKKNTLNYDSDHVFIDVLERIYNAEALTLGPEMIRRGEVDYAELTADILDDWNNNEETKKLISRERPKTDYSQFYCFNFDPQFDASYEPANWKKAVNNENFRQALAAGLNRLKSVSVLEPDSPDTYIINSITPIKFTYNEDGKDYTEFNAIAALGDTYDEAGALKFKAIAIEELSAAGVTFPVKVLMPYNPEIPNWDKESQVVEQQMEALLGADFIDIIIEPGPADNFLTEVRRSGKYAFMKSGWAADYADPETWTDPFYQEKGEGGYKPGYKYSFFAKAIEDNTKTAETVTEYFALVDAAKAIKVDTNSRFEAFAEAEAYLINHALAVPYSIQVSLHLANKLDVFEAQYAPFGVSWMRYKGMTVKDHYISMEEYEANRK